MTPVRSSQNLTVELSESDCTEEGSGRSINKHKLTTYIYLALTLNAVPVLSSTDKDYSHPINEYKLIAFTFLV